MRLPLEFRRREAGRCPACLAWGWVWQLVRAEELAPVLPVRPAPPAAPWEAAVVGAGQVREGRAEETEEKVSLRPW